MTEEDEEFERIAKKRQYLIDYIMEPPLVSKQKEWVGLTNKDKQKLAAEHHDWESLCFAVEAKLKEKNT